MKFPYSRMFWNITFFMIFVNILSYTIFIDYKLSVIYGNYSIIEKIYLIVFIPILIYFGFVIVSFIMYRFLHVILFSRTLMIFFFLLIFYEFNLIPFEIPKELIESFIVFCILGYIIIQILSHILRINLINIIRTKQSLKDNIHYKIPSEFSIMFKIS